MTEKHLPQASGPSGLGVPTIMDAGLAARYGTDYVHLAVFAIDVDRLREGIEIDPSAVEWPFGWEVFLTELYLLDAIDPEAQRELVEDVCLTVIEERSFRLGSQVAFAVHDLVRRGLWPAGLGAIFRSWRKASPDLVHALDGLFADRGSRSAELAAACLAIPVEPPLAPPTEAVLRRMAA